MTKLLLSIHVLAAIIAIGPVTVAASMFPAATRRVLSEPGDQRGVAVLHNLHRICRVYAALGVLVPVFGLATASSLGVLGDAWLIISMVLTVVAAAVLAFLVLPGQTAILQATDALASSTAAGQVIRDREVYGVIDTTQSEAIDRPLRTATTPTDSRPARATAANRDEVASPDGAILKTPMAARLGMITGLFNLLWAVVVVLMIVRPGSTTGA